MASGFRGRGDNLMVVLPLTVPFLRAESRSPTPHHFYSAGKFLSLTEKEKNK